MLWTGLHERELIADYGDFADYRFSPARIAPETLVLPFYERKMVVRGVVVRLCGVVEAKKRGPQASLLTALIFWPSQSNHQLQSVTENPFVR